MNPGKGLLAAADPGRHTRPLSRRSFIARTGLVCLIGTGTGWAAPTKSRVTPAIAFDEEIQEFMRPRRVPGGAIAVVKDGQTVYAHGYGWADRGAETPVTAESLFRIASLSKPITSLAIMKLVEAGKLELDARVTELLDLKPGKSGDGSTDSRWEQITVNHCLHHTGGWDRGRSGDPMFKSREIARAADVPAPALQDHIIRYMLARPLDFDPGTREAYSNFGYCLLGRVIEQISGTRYEKFVQEQVLATMGIRNMHLGTSLEPGRAKNEVKYYTPTNRKAPSVFDSRPGNVPVPYGSFCLEAMDSHGGWLASAVDLARFAATLGQSEGNACLKPDFLRRLYEPPRPPVARQPNGTLQDHYYACGWAVRPVGRTGRANYWHTGSLPGTFTILVRRHDGLSWIALFNQRSEDPKLPDSSLDAALHRAADRVTDWAPENSG